ncbi:reverse transcriptase domain-containing protein [Tanacetum coccineum]
MTHLLEKDTPFFFSDECLASFKILKKKLTEAPILVSPDWDLPFELMCDASDFAVGAVLGNRKDKYFRPIHYVSMTLSDVQMHYTTTKKELLAVVYAFEKFQSYLLLSKTIIRDKKGAENLVVDHLSRLENPHQGDLVDMEMNDNFPHESLNMISFNPDNEPLWMTPITFGFVLIRLLGGVWTGRKLWIFSKLVIMVPPGDIMTQTTPPKKFLTLVFSGPPYIAMPRTLSHTVEAKALPTNDARVVVKFLKHLFSRFGTPRAIITYENSLFYKEKTKKIHDAKIKNREFHIGDRVLLFNSRLKIFSGKLKSRLSRPFTIAEVFPYGTVELSQPDGPNFKVNGHRIKHYFGGDIPTMDVSDLHLSPKDN